jgi:hypothetical protein
MLYRARFSRVVSAKVGESADPELRGLTGLLGFGAFLIWEARKEGQRWSVLLKKETALLAAFAATLVTTNAYFIWRAAPSFSHCVYLKKSHTGLADSRNAGIQAARGTHVAFLDADDLWSPNYLAVMQEALAANPQVEVACCNGMRVLASGEILSSFFPPGLPPVNGRIGTARELFSFFLGATPSALVIAKSAFERVGLFDLRFPVFGQDWHWVIRAVRQGIRCFRLDRKLVLYRVHGANVTGSSDKMFEAWLEIYADTLRGGADPELRAYALRFTRRFVPALLARLPGPQSRTLLRHRHFCGRLPVRSGQCVDLPWLDKSIRDSEGSKACAPESGPCKAQN